jgi:hypothetical protein
LAKANPGRFFLREDEILLIAIYCSTPAPGAGREAVMARAQQRAGFEADALPAPCPRACFDSVFLHKSWVMSVDADVKPIF